MGGMGHLYEVVDSARETLHTCKSKGDWYDSMGDYITKSNKELDTEDCLRSWAAFIPDEPYPISHLLKGEFHSENDDYWDQPHVSFIGSNLVKEILSELKHKGKDNYENRLISIYPSMQGEIWLYDPLCKFLESVASRNNAVIVLGSRYYL